jgi:glycosyltransferase involved in cell wall biosynthesis
MGMDKSRGVPSISVVMPVHNALPYLDASIKSILAQTFTDFELVILDDASTDGSTERLREWAATDKRIRLHRGRRNLGTLGTSNAVVHQARASIIARMDADDLSHPERLGRQWDALRTRPEVALVGTLYDGIDEQGRRVRPPDRWGIARGTYFPPFAHGSIMFRRAAFDAVGGYHEECHGWEDQDFLLRMRGVGSVVVLTDTLYHYRYQAQSVTSSRSIERAASALKRRRLCMKELRRGRDYTGLLKGAERNEHYRQAWADALYLRGAMRLWAGHSPDILRPALERKALELTPGQLKTLVLATFGSLSPASLRLCLRMLIRARDLVASHRVKDGGIYEWRLE